MQRELIKRNNANLKQANKNGKKKRKLYLAGNLCDFGQHLNDKRTKKSEIDIQVSSINNLIIPLKPENL